MQCSPENIRKQQEFLQLHRKNAYLYYRQALVHGGVDFAPVTIQHGLKQACAAIAACKAILRAWNILIHDNPEDDLFTSDKNLSAQSNNFQNITSNQGAQGIFPGQVNINNYNYSSPAEGETEDLLASYRREIAHRCAQWRDRYAAVQVHAELSSVSQRDIGYELEDQFFRTSYHTISAEAPDRLQDTITFTDLRKGLLGCGDMLLLGPPGSGKTTALWRLALDLAEDGLNRNPQAPLPVFVRLSRLKSGQDLIEHIQSELAQATLKVQDNRSIELPKHQALAPLLPQLLKEGRLVLLWDGLNETPPDIFAETARQIAQLHHRYPSPLGGPTNQHLITCRTDDYELLITQHSIELPSNRAMIQPLDTATVRHIALTRLGKELGEKLLEALKAPHQRTLYNLARTPLLLRLLCAVYKGNQILPDTRAQLLEQFIQMRIQWEQDWQRQSDDQVVKEVRFSQYDLAWPLARLAYAMIEKHWYGSVSWEWAKQQLASARTTLSPYRVRALAQSADLLEPAAGEQEVGFTHQLIQEYFAAIALREELSRLGQHGSLSPDENLGPLERYAAPGRRTGWEETLLLLAGLDGDSTVAPALVRRFLAFPLDAARLLHASGDANPALLDELRNHALAQLRNRYEPTPARLTAARALALAGDPRFPVTLEAWRDAVEQARAGDRSGYFCRVEPGDYWLGADPPGGADDQPRHRMTLDAPLWIARLPITKAQWLFWAEADGGVPDPGDGVAREDANEPVADASWAQARAFCGWLGGQLGVAVRLPTEHEWEAAAAGPEGRHYPWGDSWQHDRAATQENRDTRGHRNSMPVGCFPAGASPCGALDLAGNVWEWAVERPEPHPGEDWPVQRGGSYQSLRRDARCAARSRIDQSDEGLYAGFRVVVELTAETQRTQRELQVNAKTQRR